MTIENRLQALERRRQPTGQHGVVLTQHGEGFVDNGGRQHSAAAVGDYLLSGRPATVIGFDDAALPPDWQPDQRLVLTWGD